MPVHRSSEQFNKEETQLRFEAALRGARLVGHKPLKDIPKKNRESRVGARKRRGKKTK